MQSVLHTLYSNNFPAESAKNISVLDKTEAALAFENAFGKGFRTYFDFPETHWLVQAKEQVIGLWLEPYNTGRIDQLGALLKKSVEWKPDTEIYFFAKKSLVFQTQWKEFCAQWDSFLACEDDCPILMQSLNIREALLFTSLGEIRHIK